jgi:heparan-alpha-glucosaminide N-acetyltransferase
MTQTIWSHRIASVDILRAITMVLMIFVNDLWSLQNIPHWLEHVPADADGMGLADVVFPAFLFIVGMSLPFAIRSRMKKGDSQLQILKHIVIRSGALIIMGLFLVNGEYLNEEATGIPRLVWNVLACTSFILLFNNYGRGANRWVVRIAKATGVITLGVLAFICGGGEGNDVHGFSTYWWGILGLIGWAYFISGVGYVSLGKKFAGVIFLWLLFNLICVAVHAKWISGGDIFSMLAGPFSDGAMPVFVTGGTITSLIYLHFRNASSGTKMILILMIIATALLVIGFYTRPFWGISKIRATPSWVWICSAITIFSFIVIYYIADVKQKTSWFNFIKPAGTNTLLCYLIPHFAYALVVWINIDYPHFMLNGITGLIKSLIFALLVVWIAGWMERKGIQLKL